MKHIKSYNKTHSLPFLFFLLSLFGQLYSAVTLSSVGFFFFLLTPAPLTYIIREVFGSNSHRQERVPPLLLLLSSSVQLETLHSLARAQTETVPSATPREGPPATVKYSQTNDVKSACIKGNTTFFQGQGHSPFESCLRLC
jgi:hypothetical protein